MIAFTSLKILFKLLPTLLLFAGLAGCLIQDRPEQPVIKPVKSYRVTEISDQRHGTYSGEVKPKVEAGLSFRVPGKMLDRTVNIGERIKKGQVLARLDNSDYLLAWQASKAQLIAAKTEMKLAADEWSRYRELLKQQVISPPDLDQRETAYVAAKERVNAFQAQLNQSRNQIRYTRLLADQAGVITGVHAEPGQVVNAGQPVLSVAQDTAKEIHFDVPEDQIHRHHTGDNLQVFLWRDEEHSAPAEIKDIAASADPANRTYKVKATLLDDSQQWQLGRSVTVRFNEGKADAPVIPLSAVFMPKDNTDRAKIWLIDEQKLTVTTLPVRLGEPLPGGRIAVTGVKPGQLLVSAGVNRLREGQIVRLLEEDPAEPERGSASIFNRKGT